MSGYDNLKMSEAHSSWNPAAEQLRLKPIEQWQKKSRQYVDIIQGSFIGKDDAKTISPFEAAHERAMSSRPKPSQMQRSAEIADAAKADSATNEKDQHESDEWWDEMNNVWKFDEAHELANKTRPGQDRLKVSPEDAMTPEQQQAALKFTDQLEAAAANEDTAAVQELIENYEKTAQPRGRFRRVLDAFKTFMFIDDEEAAPTSEPQTP